MTGAEIRSLLASKVMHRVATIVVQLPFAMATAICAIIAETVWVARNGLRAGGPEQPFEEEHGRYRQRWRPFFCLVDVSPPII